VKFKYRLLTAGDIRARVIEEEQRTGNEVVSVELTPTEWRMFAPSVGLDPTLIGGHMLGIAGTSPYDPIYAPCGVTRRVAVTGSP
jgi:hypothetical protein